MKNNNNNFWKAFSRGIASFVLILAIIFGFCGLGATLAQIPWFLIAGAICLILIIGTGIWFLGYQSRQVQPAEEEPAAQPQPTEEVIIIRKRLTPEQFNQAYNMFADEEAEEIEEE